MSSNSRSTAKNKVNNDPVDELKRRSRRRLVGSIALFLAVILIVPALIESEQVPSSSEVELIVPERPSADVPAAPAQSTPETRLEAPESRQKFASEVAPVAPPVEPPPILPEPKPEPKPAPKPEPKPAPKPEPEPKPEPKVKPKAELKPETNAVAEDPIASFAKAKTYWVQVAAVSDKLRADALASNLSNKGFSAKVEPANTGSGTVYRVRVGPISGQTKADETKSRLSAAGFSNGRVVQ